MGGLKRELQEKQEANYNRQQIIVEESGKEREQIKLVNSANAHRHTYL